MATAYYFARVVAELREEHRALKGFDPYEILGVDEFTPPEAIRKAYRKLALIYHPDRNDNDPQAAAKFIMISKAYECLTNPVAKENCQKFGNPDGSSSFNVGIALPSFLIKKEHQVKVMAVVFLILMILIPSVLIYWNSEMNKYDEFGMLRKNHPEIYRELNEQLSIGDVPKVLAMCAEFDKHKCTKEHSVGLEEIRKHCDDDTSRLIAALLKKNLLNWCKRTAVLCDLRVKEGRLPPELESEYMYVLKEVPRLVNAIISFILPFSVIWFKPFLKEQKFMGLGPVQSLIWFLQHFIQGREFGSQNYQQLDLTAAELEAISKKRKQKVTVQKLQTSEEELDKFLSLVDPARRDYIKTNVFMFPIVDCAVRVFTEDEQDLTDRDIVTCEIVLTRKNPNAFGFAVAPRYPFLKEESWYVILALEKRIIHFEKIAFDEPCKTVKYLHPKHLLAGQHTWRLFVMPDCYYGADISLPVSFTVLREAASQRQVPMLLTQKFQAHPDDRKLEHTHSYLEQVMSSMNPQEDQQMSDDEDEAELERHADMPPLEPTAQT